jgi:hypothetical protein
MLEETEGASNNRQSIKSHMKHRAHKTQANDKQKKTE